MEKSKEIENPNFDIYKDYKGSTLGEYVLECMKNKYTDFKKKRSVYAYSSKGRNKRYSTYLS